MIAEFLIKASIFAAASIVCFVAGQRFGDWIADRWIRR